MGEFVSDWIGKPLLTRGGERIGYVKNVQTDKNLRRVRNLECVGEEDEEEFLLPASAVAQWGKDAIVAARRANSCKNCLPAPFGVAVYSAGGEALGPIDDFARDGLDITGIRLADGKLLPVGALRSLTDTAIVDPDGALSPVVRRQKAPARPKAARAKPAQAAQEIAPAAQEAAPDGPADELAAARPAAAGIGSAAEPAHAGAPESGTSAAADAAPQGGAVPAESSSENGTQEPSGAPLPRKRAGSALLTGKTLPDDLLDVRGNVLAPRGTVVTAETIRRAMRHDKLFALTLLCTRESRGL